MTTALVILSVALGVGVCLLYERARRHRTTMASAQRELEERVEERTRALEERTRELAAADEARSRFFARVSHEIRTPVSGILGINRLLLQTPLEGRQRELAEIVQAQGGTLLRIINELLDYAKLEAGHFGIEPLDFSLRNAIADVARVHGEQARAKQLGFAVEIDAALPEFVHGDAVRLRQVLDNLLTNAVKFTESGAITLRAARLTSEPDEVVARFEVVDTGIGLSAEAAGVLFQPFVQAETSTQRKYGGTGLGLAIAKSLVEMMGGEIGCAGEPGRGSTFWFTIRVGVVQGQPQAASRPKDEREAAPRRSGHILVAEDNEINSLVTAALLLESGCTVHVVRSGFEVLNACESHAYDLVLMDCRMPEMDGYEAATELRRAGITDSGGRRLPIVALTAHAVSDEGERCIAAGMDDWLTKPATPETLGRVLSRWLPAGPIHEEALADLERRSPAAMRTVIDHYLDGIPKDIVTLRAAVEIRDTERIRAMAHTIAGSALIVGARGFADVLREAEARNPPADLGAWFERVDTEHRRVIDALSARVVT
jgi:signal transduction histidine kinase/CheY-like chemotaxis protein/HPt (histidine-containing phosphotransfer) domain-containing protein